jgi:2-oxoisovalerate dehydrogenase E1 component alpha subunit
MRRASLRRTAPPRSALHLLAGSRRLLSRSLSLEEENSQLRQQLLAAQELLAKNGNGNGNAWGGEEGEQSKFVGAQGMYTPELRFLYPNEPAPHVYPVFRVMDDNGAIVPGAAETDSVPELDRDLAVACIHTMVRVSEFDKIFNDAQRQGRIAFYLTSRGEEAASVGSAAALDDRDWMLPQYREMGAFFWRGFSFDDVANQLCGNGRDSAHGRQLPLHVGGRKGHLLTISSTLGTQVPQAAGVAFSMRQQEQDRVGGHSDV